LQVTGPRGLDFDTCELEGSDTWHYLTYCTKIHKKEKAELNFMEEEHKSCNVETDTNKCSTMNVDRGSVPSSSKSGNDLLQSAAGTTRHTICNEKRSQVQRGAGA
ncbi:hypothetical protein ILYODFUR_037655, partial [Ilyodon furcidens]